MSGDLFTGLPALAADYEFHFNGLTYGADHPVAVTRMAGFRGYTARVTDRELDRGHGARRGPSWTAARDLRQTLEVTGDPEECERLLDEVGVAFGPQVTAVVPLLSRLPGAGDTVHYCYPVAVPHEVEAGRERSRAVEVSLRAPDPRIYSSTVENVGVPLYTGGGASGFNGPIVNGPVNMTAVTVQQAVVTNDGWDDAWPVVYFRVDSGTATSVTVSNQTTGEAVTVTTSMSAGQLLTFDTAAAEGVTDGRVADLAGSNRYGSWAAPWTGMRLQAGSNVLQATAVGATAVSVWVEYQHTSLS